MFKVKLHLTKDQVGERRLSTRVCFHEARRTYFIQ